jgi:predicted RNase H-like nuclease (RuvC/YqgF family)
MSQGKETGLTSPTKLSGLSPEKYGKTAFRELSYTPEKLSENFLYKEVTVTKKIEVEKKRIRELESTCAVQVEKIRQLETENETLRKSYQLQIDMYKQMLKEQEDEKAKHIRTLQASYNLEIQRLLNEH